MSEYQLYDFYAIDQLLSKRDKQEIEKLSSRVSPSANRATFVYNYGDFHHDETEVLVKYFDFMLYVANWGTYRIMMRFPASIVPYQDLKRYEIEVNHYTEQYVAIDKKGDYVILDLNYSIEDSDWIDGEGLLDELLPLREQIINGDYRVLYLAWLHLASTKYMVEENDVSQSVSSILEPPLPDNLKKTDTSLNNFIDFWGINTDLVESAAENSSQKSDDEDLEPYIAELSEKEKEYYLIALLENSTKAKQDLKKRLSTLAGINTKASNSNLRYIVDIVDNAQKYKEARIAKEKNRQREQFLEKMKNIEIRLVEVWSDVYTNARQKSGRGYDNATQLLVELKQYYEFSGQSRVFQDKAGLFAQEFSRSSALQKRLKEAKVL